MTRSLPLREQARAARPADSRPATPVSSEPTVVFDVGEDPESVPVRYAWARVMRFCRALPKGSTATVSTSKGGSFSYRYRGVDDVVSLAGAALREFGVMINPVKIDVTHRVGTPSWCKVDVTYSVTSLGEGEIVGVSCGEALDFGDKALVKALTQAYRVFLTTALSLPTYDVSMDSDARPITRPMPPSPFELRDEMLDPKTSLDRLRAILDALQRDQDLATTKVPVPDGKGGETNESLLFLNLRIGKERADRAAISAGDP